MLFAPRFTGSLLATEFDERLDAHCAHGRGNRREDGGLAELRRGRELDPVSPVMLQQQEKLRHFTLTHRIPQRDSPHADLPCR